MEELRALEPQKRLTFSEILARAEELAEHRIYVDELSGYIPYRDLTVEDFAELMRKRDEDPMELAVKAFCKAWNKADPSVKVEAVKTKIPLRIVLKVINESVPELFASIPLGKQQGTQLAELSISSNDLASPSKKSEK